ncbi:four helix bundle protein [Patescibacteria group bacterium]
MNNINYIFPYQKFEIYELSKKLIKRVYSLSDKFPNSERYNLTDQIKRAVVSVCLNIVEGNSRSYKKVQAKFADIAIGLLMEVNVCIDISIDMNYLHKQELNEFKQILTELYFKLLGYKRSKYRY